MALSPHALPSTLQTWELPLTLPTWKLPSTLLTWELPFKRVELNRIWRRNLTTLRESLLNFLLFGWSSPEPQALLSLLSGFHLYASYMLSRRGVYEDTGPVGGTSSYCCLSY